MTVTNSHAELPERDWTEHFPESPPDFRDGPDFRESIAPFIAEPETYEVKRLKAKNKKLRKRIRYLSVSDGKESV